MTSYLSREWYENLLGRVGVGVRKFIGSSRECKKIYQPEVSFFGPKQRFYNCMVSCLESFENRVGCGGTKIFWPH